MKQFISCFLILLMALSFCSCDRIETFLEGNSVKQEEAIAVSQTSEATITLNTYSLDLTTGNTYQLVGAVNPQKTLMWRSSNENVALVNSQGVVTAVNAGAANIICYANGAVDAVCTVTVKGATTPSVESSYDTSTYVYNDSGDFIFPHSSVSYLTESEIYTTLNNMSGYSPTGKYAQDAINEIYARNGYVFKTEKIANYYNAKSWYVPDSGFSVSELNKYEQKNVSLLKKYL